MVFRFSKIQECPRIRSPKPKSRPKTSIPVRVLSPQSTVLDTPTPEFKTITTIQNIVLQAKNTMENSTSSSTSPSFSSHSTSSAKQTTDILERYAESLKSLEGFWFTYNKVEVDYMEIKEEKKDARKGE
ncbi:hypothetical protein JTB14_035328 [Gonioctena quinquepunctata]|nr:hypothetical protein JTB14_035328 [Gonioctena quinquepunctata]